MSDCLQNEDSIVSDLSSSNADSLTGTLDSGDNINSDISIGDAMVSSISDGDSTDSNLGDDGSLYSELSSGGVGGAKYTGQETDNIEIIVDNNVYTISANLKPIKFNSISDFPLVGSEKLIYVDFSNKTLYGWDSAKGVYYKLVADVKVPTKLSEFTNDAGFITNTVNNLVEYYKKTETYTQEEIDSKISAIPKFAIKVVAELPTTDISETTVYLVASGSDNQNLYIEYIYVNGVWEKLGEQTLDLSNVVNSINGKTGEVQLTAEDVGALSSDTPLFSGNYNDLSNKPTIPTNNNQLTNGAGYITPSGLNGYVKVADIQNSLSSTDTDKPLSAYQGNLLYGQIVSIGSNLNKRSFTVIDTQYIRITDLDSGIYKLTYNGHKFLYYYGRTSNVSQQLYSNGTLILFVTKNITQGYDAYYWTWEVFAPVADNRYPAIHYGITEIDTGTARSSRLDVLDYAKVNKPGVVAPDGETITINSWGTISAKGGGSKVIWEVWE